MATIQSTRYCGGEPELASLILQYTDSFSQHLRDHLLKGEESLLSMDSTSSKSPLSSHDLIFLPVTHYAVLVLTMHSNRTVNVTSSQSVKQA